jgi:hypothetical protein
LAQPVEITVACNLHLRDEVQSHQSRRFLPLLEGEMLPQPPLEAQLVAPQRTLNADEKMSRTRKGKIVSN